MKTISTKKAFKEQSSIHVYGKGQSRFTVLFWDWETNDNGRGFSHAYGCRGYSKKDIIDEAFEVLMHGRQIPWWAYFKSINEDKNRFKVPLVWTGNIK